MAGEDQSRSSRRIGHRQLSHSSARHPTKIQEIFVGMAFTLHHAKPKSGAGSAEHNSRDMEYTMVLHDGTGVMESETFHRDFELKEGDEESRVQAAHGLAGEVLGRLTRLQEEKKMDIRVVAVAEPIPDELKDLKGVEFAATVWLHLDAIPFIIAPATSMFTKLPPLPTEAGATSAVQGALKFLHPATHSATTADTDPKDHHVLVDCDKRVQLCSLLQYEQSTSPELWARFIALSTHLTSHHTSIAFFSATPQGGGVALMRHALIRLWRLVGLDVKWYTPEGHPAVFDITKRKIHNVLQGVAEEGEEMNDEDKRWFEAWTEQNYEKFWADGAIDADLIVIDDPQLSALVPIIKKHRPDSKIIFRSHIQIQSALTDDPSTPQHRTWNYLYSFIKDVDLFLAHPVKEFVPKCVRDSLPVLYMAPSTDPLDGLNKPYGTASVQYYRQVFNDLARSQGGNIIDWDRGYICQIGRFDPSKGIDVLLEAYLRFRQKLEKLDNAPEDGGPQLIIMGHGSVDDPDGTLIYEQIHETLGKEEYKLVSGDVAVVRAPPSDSILGCILQGAWVATQLSTREGFEVKVTEAINKRVPIIASDAGGIPLQVKQGENGWIVPSGNSEAVASLLVDIHTGKEKVKREISDERKLDKADIGQIHGETADQAEGGQKSDPNAVAEAFVRDFDRPMIPIRADKAATSEDFWTVGNAAKWMLLASRVLGLDVEGGRGGDERSLADMGVGQGLKTEVLEGNVWGMVMGSELVEGEGAIRAHQ